MAIICAISAASFHAFIPSRLVPIANAEKFYLAGKIVSEVERERSRYGEQKVSFVLESANPRGRVKVFLKNQKESFSYGDQIAALGSIQVPRGQRNPGGFNYRAYLSNNGVSWIFFGEKNVQSKILARHKGFWLREKALALREKFSQSLKRNFPKDEAAFLNALLLGERSGLEESLSDLFMKTGTLHILSVSGFNVGFLVFAVLWMLKPFPVHIYARLWIVLFAVWFYCLIVGFQAPVIRASVMASVLIFSKLLGRRADLLNSLGLAALVILAVNSRQVFDVGFQLSFLAVFAIAVILPRFTAPVRLLPGEKLNSFVCQIATLPVTVQNFYIVSPSSLLANLVVVPISFLLFLLGFIYFLTLAWVPKFLMFLPLASKVLMSLLVKALVVLENCPGAYFISGKLNWALWAILCVGIIFIVVTKHIENRIARAIILILFCANVFMVQEVTRHFGRSFRMTAIDVGQGDATFLEFPNGGNMLVDAGMGPDPDQGRLAVTPFLRLKGIRDIDALVMSHPQADHIGGMETILKEFKIRAVIDGGSDYPSELYERVNKLIAEEGAERHSVFAGEKINGFKDISILVFNPQPKIHAKNVNNDSVVLKLSYGDTDFLLTGDIEEEAMRSILESKTELSAEVLKAPHHGAKLKDFGVRFVQAVHPLVSTVSVGERNRYHHPNLAALSVLGALPGSQVLRTDEKGAVQLISDGSVVKYEPFNYAE